MKKLIAIAVASLFATAALAQTTPGTPPAQVPAGEPGKLTKPKIERTPKPEAAPAAAPMTKAEKKAARKAKREAKVGDKPIN